MEADLFFQRSPWAQWCVDQEGRLLRYNDAFGRMLPLRNPGSSRPNLFTYVSEDEQRRLRETLQSLPARGTEGLVLTFPTADAGPLRTRWALRHDGGIAYAVELPREVELPAESVRQPAAEPAGAGPSPGISPESLLGLVHQSHDMMARFDGQLRYSFVNDRLLAQTGTLAAADFIGKTTVDMAPLLGVSPDNFDNWMRDLQKVLLTGAEVHHYDSLELPDHTIHFQTKMFPEYQDGTVSGVLVITRINNELKVARRRLGERRNLLKMVFDCMQEGVLVVNKQGRFLLSNQSGRTLTPMAPLPTSYREWNRQVEAYGADGKTPLPDADQPLGVALRGGMIQNQVVFFRERTGKWEVYLNVNASALKRPDGEIVGAVLVYSNVSGQLKAREQLEAQNAELLLQENKLLSQREELRRTVAQLEERNFELDQLIYKTSHDIRSPLTSVLGLVNIIGLEADKSRWPVYLEMIEDRIKKLDRFLQSMIFYAKASRSSLVIRPVDFTQLLERTTATLSFIKKADQLQIDLRRTGEEVVFASDPFRLEILFNNIVSNAIKYQNPAADTHYLRVSVDVTPLEARITFSDNGIGIKPEYAGRVFEMFYRATENTDGSGLGLYIVKQIVDKMKGTIRLESQYGRGTTLRVTLPNASASSGSGNQPPPGVPGNG